MGENFCVFFGIFFVFQPPFESCRRMFMYGEWSQNNEKLTRFNATTWRTKRFENVFFFKPLPPLYPILFFFTFSVRFFWQSKEKWGKKKAKGWCEAFVSKGRERVLCSWTSITDNRLPIFGGWRGWGREKMTKKRGTIVDHHSFFFVAEIRMNFHFPLNLSLKLGEFSAKFNLILGKFWETLDKVVRGRKISGNFCG